MTVADRLLSKYEILENGCWRYTGGLNGQGRGNIWDSGRTRSAHVVSFEIHKGPIPEGMQVCHTCDFGACINPDHLFLGTQLDNIHDMINKGRDRVVGSLNGQSKLTEADVVYIRRLLMEGLTNSEIARRFNVTSQAVGLIKRRRSWRHVL
jgi:hypothetical protein